jgi:hypothetical protein
VLRPIEKRHRTAAGSGLSLKTSVKLSIQERQIARLSGVSEADYARNKLKMMQYKKSGLIVDEG